jgi:putative ABC transport system permease protein
MTNGVIEIEMWRMTAAYLFIAVLIAIVKWRGIKREKLIILATIRMTIQLSLVGYVLAYLFERPHPLVTLAVILCMLVFAIYTIFQQVKGINQTLKGIIILSMLTGPVLSLFYFQLIVIHLQPWYDPRYFITIGGMIIGGAMTGITLAIKRLVEGMNSERRIVEAALMLGAKPEHAMKSIVNSAFDSAILPTVNSMLGMGIIFLPGMMTGQILSGTSPLLSIQYQIVILLGILGGVSTSTFLFLQLAKKAFFNEHKQLF